MPGPGAIPSCCPPQRPRWKWTYLFHFYKSDMKGRAFRVFIMTEFALATPRKTPSENQRAAALLMLDPSGLRFWDQLVRLDSLIPLTFALMCFDLSEDAD